MRRNIGLLILMLGMTQFAFANTSDEQVLNHYDPVRVGKIKLMGDFQSWTRLDDDTIIIWSTAFRPYLVELSRKAPDLRFADAIGVTSTVGLVQEKFDNIVVDGIRYPIEGIYELDRESAKQLKKDSKQR